MNKGRYFLSQQWKKALLLKTHLMKTIGSCATTEAQSQGAEKMQANIRFSIPSFYLFNKSTFIFNAPPDSDPYGLLMVSLRGNDYRPFVIDDGVVRRLHFNLMYVQSEMTIKKPYELRFSYIRKMMIFMLLNISPEHVVIVGLGGGSLTKYCYRYLLNTRVTTLEIDPEVIGFGDLFHLPEQDERHTILQTDAAQYISTTTDIADVILLDGCDERGISQSFFDICFYQNSRARLSPNGFLVINLTGLRQEYLSHLKMIKDAFNDQVIVPEADLGENQLAIAYNDPEFMPDWDKIKQEAKEHAKRGELNLLKFIKKLKNAFEEKKLSELSKCL
jgi:spermidine synthase